MDNNGQAKVFDSAGAGRFQFENKAIEKTPEQIAKEEADKKAKQAQKKRLKIIATVGGILLAIVLIIVTVLLILNIRKGEKGGEVSVIPKDEMDNIVAESNLVNSPDAYSTIETVNEAITKIEESGDTNDENYAALLQIKQQVISNNDVALDEYIPTYEKIIEQGNLDDYQTWYAHLAAADFARDNLLNYSLEIEILNKMIAILDEKGPNYGDILDDAWARSMVEDRINTAQQALDAGK